MNAAAPRNATNFFAGRRAEFFAGALLVLAALAVYANSFSAPFVFDDEGSIAENPTIRSLWPPWTALNPPHAGADGGLTVSGRPVLNFSFALNYAVSGTRVWSYHALNLCIHACAALALFGLVRRTLQTSRLRARFGDAATPLAFASALLWTVHPLQTESVTYVVQRAESLCGSFYLLTLYCFVRGAEAGASRAWPALAFVACLLGMGTKEVMVTAPLVVLLYDRTFLAGNFREALRQRGTRHLALASTWLLLIALVASNANRGGSAGVDVGVTWWAYALTQTWAIARYLALAVWPRGLVFDYGTPLFTTTASVAPQMVIVGTLVAVTFACLRRWPAFAFLGAWFFVILAPSSSVVAVATQTIAEHRMYLPLAAVTTLAVLTLHTALPRLFVLVSVALAVGLGIATARRNADFRSDLALWRDTAAKRPDNPRAHNNLGKALLLDGQLAAAEAEFSEALRLKPDYARARSNLGNVLLQSGRTAEAIAQFEQALRLRDRDAETHQSLGHALLQAGRMADAKSHYAVARQLRPEFAVEQDNNLGRGLLESGHTAEAVALFESALRARPDFPEAQNNLGNALAQLGRTADALPHYESALRARPDDALAHYNLGNALLELHRPADAAPHYEAALKLRPDFAEAHNNLGTALEQLGRLAEARTHYETALRTRPDFSAARKNLERLEAVAQKTGSKN